MPNNQTTMMIAKAGQTWPSIAFDLWEDEMIFPSLIDANPELAEVIVFEGGEPIFVPEQEQTNVDKTHLPPWRQ